MTKKRKSMQTILYQKFFATKGPNGMTLVVFECGHVVRRFGPMLYMRKMQCPACSVRIRKQQNEITYNESLPQGLPVR